MNQDSDTHPLVLYDAACAAIAKAMATDEVRKIRNEAEAMRAYARQAKNRELEVYATEIRLRAERRIGELMDAQRETVGLAQGKRTDLGPKRTQVDRPTLADAGIDKHLADRARKLAAVPAEEFEEAMVEWRERAAEEGARVSAQLARSGGRRLRKRAQANAKRGRNGPRDPYTQALEDGRAWMGRWRHVSALAPVFDALRVLIEQHDMEER